MIWFLAAQGTVFLVWTIEAFRALFGMRRIAVAATGKTFPGPFASLDAMGVWFRDPAERGRRIRLLTLTVLLFAISFLWSMQAGIAPA